MCKGRLCPAFAYDLDGLLEGFAVALLVLDGRAVRSPKRFVLTRLIAAPHAAFDTPTADHVQLRDLLGDTHRMVPNDNVAALPKPNALGLRGNRHLGEERIRAHLRTFRLEMVLGQPEGLIAELLGQNSLTDLVDQDFLSGGVNLRQRAVIHSDAVLGDHHRKARRSVMKYTDFEHYDPPARLGPIGHDSPRSRDVSHLLAVTTGCDPGGPSAMLRPV